MGNLELEDEKNLMLTGTSEVEANILTNTSEEIDVALTVTPTQINYFEPTTSQEAVETYYDLMSAQKYTEAYQYLDKDQQNETEEDFVSMAEELYKSYELLSIQAAPVWSSTAHATDPIKARTIIEDDNCKVFVVKVDIEFKKGVMGTGPSGTYQYAIPVVNRDDGWRLAEFDTILAPDICKRYISQQ
jgi:enolase